MATIIEEVNQYLHRHAGKGINPQNKCLVLIEDEGRCYEVRRCNTSVFLFPDFIQNSTDHESYETAYLLLQLGRPQAAPIQWTKTPSIYEDAEVFAWESDCIAYLVSTQQDNEGCEYYEADYLLVGEDALPHDYTTRLGRFDTPELAFGECQGHKQIRYDEMGGFKP